MQVVRQWIVTTPARSKVSGMRAHTGDASSDLAQMSALVTAGDNYVAAGQYQNAISAYQAAGNAGATTIGPEIDTATGGASQPLTQQAWQLNTQIAALDNSATTTQAAAAEGQRMAQQMVALYQQALSQGAAASAPSLQASAIAMNNALLAHGYKQADQGLYRAFETAAGLTPDGFPGTNTMGKLQQVLSAAGVQMAPVKIYPWLASGTYDGVNAPTMAEWTGGGGGAAPAPVQPAPVARASMTGPEIALLALAAGAAIYFGKRKYDETKALQEHEKGMNAPRYEPERASSGRWAGRTPAERRREKKRLGYEF
jgi:hypothetical protein